jgi:hypothetical protein
VSFLAPAFLLGATAIAIPIVIHLIQRERKRIVQFPSLMFLRRIPYQSVRRRTIRNWLLLLMRAAALLILATAFARPFFKRANLAATAAAGAREVVIALDRSASMAYGDHWQRAQAAARQVVDGLGADDRATLVLFSRNAEEYVRATPDRARLKAAVDATRVGSGSTQFGPALKLAQSILDRSQVKRREAVLISDFQKTGWSGSEDVNFPDGTTLTPMSVASPDTSNVSITSVNSARALFSGQERVTVTAGVVNRSADAVSNLSVALEIDGRQIQTQNASLGAGQSASVSFAPFTLSEANTRGAVRAGSDPMPQDNVFQFVLGPSRPVSVLVVDQSAARSAEASRYGTVFSATDPSLYLSKALSIGSAPVFQVDIVPTGRVTPASFDGRTVVILNDSPFPPAAASGVLRRFVERGGGLLVVLGTHSSWPAEEAALLPGKLGDPLDTPDGRGGTIGFLDYSHPIFEVFRAPRSGDFSSTRVYRYRSLEPGSSARVLARFGNGAVAAAETRGGGGRVIAWTSTLDDTWNDLPLKPIFLPLVQQTARYLARYQEPAAWQTVGSVLDLTALSAPGPKGPGLPAKTGARLIVTPAGQRVPLTETDHAAFLELDQQGLYEIRTSSGEERRPLTVAVNLDPAESDLTTIDPQELLAAVTGHATSTAGGQPSAAPATPAETEQRQALWWYLLLAALLVLAGETILSNRTSLKV